MSFWPKSRYTTSLEQQVAELKENVSALKKDILFEREQVGQLTIKLVEATRALAEASAKPVDSKEKKEPPRAGNWLKTRSALESQDQIVSEINPDKEKSANGSR